MTFDTAAASTSGTAWTRSVPTSLIADSVGYSISSAIMMTEPEPPTDVIPTSSPPLSLLRGVRAETIVQYVHQAR